MSFSFIVPAVSSAANPGGVVNDISGDIDLGTQDAGALFTGSRADGFQLGTEQVPDIYAQADFGAGAGAADTLVILNAERLRENKCTRLKFKANNYGANYPLQNADLMAWWDATRVGNGVDADVGVSTWFDLSGGSHNLTAATTRRPTYSGGNVDATFSYQHFITFDGISDSMLNTSIAAAIGGNDTPHTLLGVWRTTKSTFGAALGWNNSSGTRFHVYGEYNPGRPEIYRRDDAALQKSGAYGSTGSGVGTPRVVAQVFNGTTANVYINGVQLGGSPDLDVGVITFNEFRVGSTFYGGSHQDFWGGAVGEIIVCDAALGTSARNELEAYLTTKWITAGLIDELLSGATLVGPDTKDYVEEFALQSPIRYGYVQYQGAGTFSNKTKYPQEKVLFGQRLSLGREPIYTSGYRSVRSGRSFTRNIWNFNLRFEGITDAKIEEFVNRVARLSDATPFCVYDNEDLVLKGLRLLYCRLVSYTVTPRNAGFNDLTIDIEEVL